jgi:acyl-CoA synthetase (AMP-forming)/AMP-acid ligase II
LRPWSVTFAGHLPRTSNGKVRRSALLADPLPPDGMDTQLAPRNPALLHKI